jgi:Na+/H+ antiporter NhaC
MEAHAGFLSLLAPLVAIGLALATRKVVPSLATGAAVGALVSASGAPVASFSALVGFFSKAIFDLDHLKIAVFSIMVAGMVGLLSASGSMRGMVERIQGVARGPRGAVVASWLAGLVVFFDDYANCLVVGNAMGPLCDRVRVSRAKLAYVVDSTAAPVATLAIVSTWVAFQVDEIEAALAGTEFQEPAFGLFVQSLPFGFYSWFTIAFVGMIALSGRDYGAMRRAEEEARALPFREEEAERVVTGPPGIAVLSIATLVGLTFGAMFWTGWQALGEGAAEARVFEVIGAARAYDSMLIGSAAAILLASVLSMAWARMPLGGLPRGAWSGIRPVLDALVILYLAWTLGASIHATGAGDYLAGAVGPWLMPALVPAITFLLAAFISFATGTSFGTMTILIPLAIPLALAKTGDLSSPVVLATTGSVLSGACLGDHASPISDTTILSSIGSGVDLITHVRTQIPYALTTGVIALFIGYVPAGFGVSPWLLILVGVVLAFGAVRLFGRRVPPVGEPTLPSAASP